MVAAQPNNREPVSIMYLSWKDFQGYMDEFRRDIQKKFDEHTDEHRSEKRQSKSFRLALLAVGVSAASTIVAATGLIIAHLH